MAVIRKLPCTVRAVTDHGQHVYTVELEPSQPIPRFKPGQFLHLALDAYEPGGFWPDSRVFSIASSPDDERVTITYAVKGAFTGRMERELALGRPVWVKLPYGEFLVDQHRDAVLFAGGTGITAFTAFLRSLQPDQASRVLLLYGARSPDLFIYGDLARKKAGQIPCLSVRLVSEEGEGRLSVDKTWPMLQQLRDPAFYLSGPPAMLVQLREDLLAHKVAYDAIRTDAWE